MMLAENLGILLAGGQAGAGWNAWGLLSFGIGIIALLFVLRRTALLRLRRARQSQDRPRSEISRRAKREIADIECREHYEHYRRAEKLPRDGRELSPRQRQFLASISSHQQPRGES